MNRAAHKITRVAFEIGLRGRERVTTIQNRISAFASGALETVLIQSLSSLAKEDRPLALDSIELNIGNVSYQHLEEDLAAGIARCLREWAFRLPLHRLQSVEPAKGLKESGGVSEGRMFLLPVPTPRFSFSSSAGRGGLNAAIAAALQGPGDWPQLMAAVRDNHAFRCRLANEVSPELLRDLLRVLVPVDGDMIAEIFSLLASWHDCVSSASTGSHAFRRVLWECILNEVARCQPAKFSLRSFVAGVLTQLSARYSLERSVFSSKIRERLLQCGQPGPTITQPAISTSLRQALLDWVETPVKSLAQAAATRVPQDAMTAKSSQRIDQLARLLEWGVLPWSAVSGSSRDIDSEILELMAASPDDVCSLVRRLGEMQLVRKRIAGELSEKAAQRLIGALDPVNASWIFLCQQSLRRMHAQKPLASLQNRVFAQLLQELTLEYLSAHHWHAFDAASFMRFLLQGLATRQKTEYGLLLADVALRRSPKSRDTGAQSLVNSAIITLLEEDVLGVRGLLLTARRFVVRPAFQHRYCDLDVLTYWLRWRKLPAWSFAATPEEMAGRIGPLLRGLPPEVCTNALSPQAKTAIVSAGTADAPVPALQIERWLLYGIWPANVALPQNTSLAEWLENQSDSDWLQALRRSGAQESAVQRLVNHLSPSFLVRIVSLLAGARAQIVYSLLCSLSDLKRHFDATIPQQWEEQVRRYILICLLQHISTDSHELSGIEELAQSTLQALSLRWQVPYERLLLLLRQESRGKEAQLDLCLKLEARLDHLEVKTDLCNPESPACDPAQGPDLVLHYLKHGSLPENAPGLSFHALQQLASRLTEDEMTSVAHVAVPWFAGDREIARRTAILFSPPAFARLAALLFPGIRFAEEIERSLLVLAPRLSLQPAALLIAGRTFFLQHAACHAANLSKELVISGMLESLTEYTGEPQSTLVEHLVQATGSKGVVADALASLQREARFMPTELRVPIIARTPAQPADEPMTQGNALQQMERLLHSGSLAAASGLTQLMDALSSLPRELRFMRTELHVPTVATVAQPADGPSTYSIALQQLEGLLHSGSLPATSGLTQLIKEFSEGLIRKPHEYSRALRAAAVREPERRRLAKVFSGSLYLHVCRLLLSDSDFADKLEYALRAMASHFHADGDLMVAAGREELLQYAATTEIMAPADGMEGKILKSLSATLEKRTGIRSARWLRHLAGVLDVNVSFPPVAGAEKEKTAPALEETQSEIRRVTQDTTPVLVATEQNKSKDGMEDQEQDELQMLAYFLRTGDVPWWGHSLLSLSSGRFQSLLKDQPRPVLQMLRSLAVTPQVIDRIMRSLPRPDLTAIILKTVPGYGGILILYIAAGAELAEDRGLSAVQGSRVPGLHWRETLLFALDGDRSSYLPSDALRTLCGRVAQQLGLETSHYLEKLSHIANRHAAAESGYAALAEMLARMQTSASVGENESCDNREPDKKAQKRDSSTPDVREEAGPITCDKGNLPISGCENVEKTEWGEELAFPDETVLTGQLEHLLRYGILPQAIPEKSLPRFMNDLAQAFITQPEKFRKQMQRAAGCSLERKRIAWLFSPQALKHLWPMLLPSDHEQAVLCLDALSTAAISCSSGSVSESLQIACVEELLHVAGKAEKSRWETADFLRLAIHRLQKDHSLRPGEVFEHLRKKLASYTSDVQRKLGPALDRVERETGRMPITRRPGKPAPPALAARRIPGAEKTPAPLPAGEPFYVGNAGAILLWPFFSRYFQALGLLENNSFRGEEEQSRAIHLVQYLATGKLEAPEHELLLNKLLCGARPEEPLHPVTAVTEAEEDLSRQLLNSVIRTWEKIRNTSIDGLRQSFLVREGQLLRRDSDDSWMLTVSTRSYDMLLDSLPWRLSLVRQPWMKTALHVKWR